MTRRIQQFPGEDGAPVGVYNRLDLNSTIVIASAAVFAPLSTDFTDDFTKSGFTIDVVTGIITVTFKGTKLCKVLARFVCRAIDNSNVTATIGLGLNAALPGALLVSASRATVDANGAWLEIDSLVNLSNGDTLQLHGRNDTNTTNLQVDGSDNMSGAGNVAPRPKEGFIDILGA